MPTDIRQLTVEQFIELLESNACASQSLPSAVSTGRASRGNPLPPETIRALRAHVINLNQGRLSSTGEFQNSEADVEAIFSEHLVAWANERSGKKLPIVFYAHGGLTSEQGGLLTANEQVKWWLENGAFPIHFVWETGLMETLGQLINPNRRRAIDWAAPSDFALETLARGIGGVKIWDGMKVSAERASAEGGGARFAARHLKEFCKRPEFEDRIELHAVGHSAGSIFHGHFIPAALKVGVPHFRSLHFLAPAIRVDTFEKQLLDRIGSGKGVEQLSVFTMARDYELADNCFSIYRKSLLYLIHYALEPERKCPILGLEKSIREDSKLKRLFDLDKKGSVGGEVIWSVTGETTGSSATTSRTHGGFNNDAPTMQSVAHRILGHEVTPFPGTEARGLSTIESLQVQEPSLVPLLRQATPEVVQPQAHAPVFPALAAPNAGRRRALCVGIDTYPTAPLAGCANDAREWARTFQRLGFEEPRTLIDGEATYGAIREELTKLLSLSHAGDVVAFQYAGHGTQVPDLDGDESDGDTPDSDEALCPVDFASGRFVIDDDLAAIFDQTPDGVSVTVFTDCCHSGSNTRFAALRPPGAAARDTRKRFMRATPEMKKAHAAFRKTSEATRPAPRSGYDRAREVAFSACRSYEVALESDGHGHFTTRATRLLATGIAGLTNEEFQKRVADSFGPGSTQNPELHCAAGSNSRLLLAPIGGDRVSPTTTPAGDWKADVASLLENAARIFRGGLGR